MKILALDSTAKTASVALCENDIPLFRLESNNGNTHSEILLPMVEQALRLTDTAIEEVGLLACTVGPGSFTGVRIGAAVLKGLALGRDIPCVGLSALEVTAEQLLPLGGYLCPVMDARRAQFYTALFASDGTALSRLWEDQALSGDMLAERLSAYTDRPIYLAGDGYLPAKKLLEERGLPIEGTPDLCIPLSAATVAAIAYRKYLNGEAVKDTALMPTYLRLPSAERERMERGEGGPALADIPLQITSQK